MKTHSETRSMRKPLKQVRFLGSARSGTEIFWHQRITSVAGVPLVIAFIAIVIAVVGRNHAWTAQMLGSPLIAIAMILFVVTIVYHMWIGVQEIIVDYIHGDAAKYLCLLANTFYCCVAGLACVYAILKLSSGV